MEPIKTYYNSCCEGYIEDEDGNMVTLEDHKVFVKEAVQQAFKDGKVEGYKKGYSDGWSSACLKYTRW